METCITTYSGKTVDLLNPQVESIEIVDIAAALSRLPRWAGHTHLVDPYSVAQHSCCVSEACPGMEIAGLLHDAHEAYLGDWSRPLLRTIAIQLPAAAELLARLRRNLDRVIMARFDLPLHWLDEQIVHQADLQMLATERRDLMRGEPQMICETTVAPRLGRLCPWTGLQARDAFLNRFYRLVEQQPREVTSA